MNNDEPNRRHLEKCYVKNKLLQIMGQGFVEYLSDENIIHGNCFQKYCHMTIFTDSQAF